MSTIKELYKLQEIDRELASSRQARAGILEILQGNQEISSTKERLQAGRLKLEEYTRQQRSLDREIADIQSKITKFEGDLYSGRTTNTKELSGMQQEIGNLKTRKADFEDQELEKMESVEKAGTFVSGLVTRLKELETAWTGEQKKLNDELKELEKTISKLQEKRDNAAKAIDSDMLDLYEEIRKKRGTAVARVDSGICSGCRIQISSNEQQQVRSGNLTRCSSCGRILVMD